MTNKIELLSGRIAYVSSLSQKIRVSDRHLYKGQDDLCAVLDGYVSDLQRQIARTSISVTYLDEIENLYRNAYIAIEAMIYSELAALGDYRITDEPKNRQQILFRLFVHILNHAAGLICDGEDLYPQLTDSRRRATKAFWRSYTAKKEAWMSQHAHA